MKGNHSAEEENEREEEQINMKMCEETTGEKETNVKVDTTMRVKMKITNCEEIKMLSLATQIDSDDKQESYGNGKKRFW